MDHGAINGRTGLSLLNLSAATRQKIGNELERRYHDALRTAVGLDATGRSVLDKIDGVAAQAQAALWANAQAKWIDRVVSGREDPRAVYTDMLPRYQHPLDDALRALPRPWAGSFTGTTPQQQLAELEKFKQRTIAAHDDHTISDALYEHESETLFNYNEILRNMVAQQKKAEDAANAAKGAPPPAPRSALPMGLPPTISITPNAPPQ